MIITVPTWTLNPKFRLPGSSGTIRLYYTDSFNSDGVSVQGSPVRSKHFFDEMTWTLVTGVMTVATFTNLISTTNSREAPAAQVIGEIYVGNTYIGRAFAWRVPDSYGSVMTKESLDIYNTPHPPRPPQPGFLDEDQIGNLIAAALGDRNFAALGVAGVTELTRDPVNPVRPKAVGDNDPRIPPSGVFFYASQYDTFADALVSMGSSRVRLIVSEPMTTGSGTVPSTVQLEFVSNGKLTITAGNTLTIQGPVIAPAVQIFDVSASGAGIAVTNNKSQSEWIEKWWGAQGGQSNAATDTAALQAFFNTFEDTKSYTLRFTPKNDYYLSQTLTGIRLQDTRLLGLELSAGYTFNEDPDRPAFHWAGADGGTMLDLPGFYTSEIFGLAFFGGLVGDNTGADINIHIRDVRDGGGGTVRLTTGAAVRQCWIDSANTRSTWRGIKVDQANASNAEYMRFENNGISGRGNVPAGTTIGYGIEVTSTQANNSSVNGNTFRNLNRAISTDGSISASYDHNTFGNCQTGFWGVTTGNISNVDGETNGVFLNSNGARYQGRWDQIRWDNIYASSDVVIQVAGDTDLTISNSVFTDPAATPGTTDLATNFISTANPGFGSIHLQDVKIGNSASGLYLSGQTPYLFRQLREFAYYEVRDKSDTFGGRGIVIGSSKDVGESLAYRLAQSNGTTFAGAGVRNPQDQLQLAAVNALFFGDSQQFEFGGLVAPNTPVVSVAGTPGSTTIRLAILAEDAAGNRTLTNGGNGSYVAVSNANATLSGSNYVVVKFNAVARAALYRLLETDGGGVNWRSLATFAPSGTRDEEYHLVTNPSGAYGYVLPTYNETSFFILRGNLATPVTDTTTTYAVKPSDSVITCDATAGNYTVTLPAANSSNKGRRYTFKRIDASGNLPTISGGGTNIDGAATYTGLSAQWKFLTVESGANLWLIVASN